MSGIISDSVVQIAGAVGGGALGFFARSILQLIRGDKAWERGELSELRKELELSRQREMHSGQQNNTLATGCELLLIAMPPHPTPEQKKIIARVRILFETTALHSDGAEDGGA